MGEKATTASGFSRANAEDLGVVFVRGLEPPSLAEWRVGGATVAWDGETIEEVLHAIEDWHRYRLRCGAADPVAA